MPQPIKVTGVVLPDGEHREVYVVDGRVTFEAIPNAQDVGSGWIIPGLVDAHCHIGLDEHGAVPDEIAEEQALADRDAGTLLARDAGSPADTRWMDERADLPRIIRAGRHLARPRRYIRNYAHEIEPDELAAYVTQEARRGDGWVKLVGDWIDRDVGDLLPLWPADALRAAMEAAHAEGARVTAHVFGEHALPDLIESGIDCIEHGTGLSPDLIELMAQRRVALVPTVVQLENFPNYASAGETKFPTYAAHIRDLYARRSETLRAAHEAGVPIYAGTDAGGVLPHGLIADEIRALSEIVGMSAEEALAAGCWAARSWLGRTATLEEGAPADLIVLDADPRENLATLKAPRRIVLRGRVVG